MGLFGRFQKDKNQPADFSGEESAASRLFVPSAVVTLKDRYDDMVEKLLAEGKVNGYACTPRYKEHRFVPSELEVTAKMDGKPVFSETIHLWQAGGGAGSGVSLPAPGAGDCISGTQRV